MKNLQAAAAAAGQTVEEFCADTPRRSPESTPAEPSPPTGGADPAQKEKLEPGEAKDKPVKPAKPEVDQPGKPDKPPPDKPDNPQPDKKEKDPKAAADSNLP